MQTLKNKKASKKTSKRYRLLVGVLVIVVLTVISIVGYQLYNQHAISADRARFEKADKDVDTVSAAIVAAVGQPIRQNRNRSCSRPSREFETAPLSCSTGNDIYYEVSDAASATELSAKIGAIMRKSWQLKSTSQSSALSTSQFHNLSSNGPSQEIFESYYLSTALMMCLNTYTFYDDEDLPLAAPESLTHRPLLMSSFSCTARAKRAYFSNI